MIEIADITELGEKLLSMNPDLVPRYRILRDILHVLPQDSRFVAAKQAIGKSKWVELLREEQRPDGSWGRFHTEDTKRKQRIYTTQYAINRGIELGLDRRDSLMIAAIHYMEDVLADRRRWSDPYEKNVWFAPGVKIFTAAVLTTIDPENPQIAGVWESMSEIYRRTLQSGVYSISEERSASLEILGVDISESYISISSAPNLELIGSFSQSFPIEMQQALFQSIWDEHVRPFYLRPRPSSFPDSITARDFVWWLHTIKVMTRISTPPSIAESIIDWFWKNRRSDGLWDGPRQLGRNAEFPLSESWRRTGSRSVDYSTQIASLISRLVKAA